MDVFDLTVTAFNAALFTVLALLAARQWSQRRGATSAWLALTFSAVSTILLSSTFAPDGGPTNIGWALLDRLNLALLILFPWFLYRFATSFGARRRLGTAVDSLTVAALTAVMVAPLAQLEGDDEPMWLVWLLLGVICQWLTNLGLAAVRLWWAGRGQPTIARRRMRIMSLGTVGLTAALIVLVAGGDGGDAADVLGWLLATGSGIAFFVGFFTPRPLRILWRQPEQDAMRAGVAELLSVDSVEQLQELILPHMARLVASDKIVFMTSSGEVLAVHGVSRDRAEAEASRFAEAAYRQRKRELLARGAVHRDAPILPLDFPFGVLLVWSNPYMPFFGADEFELMQSLGVIFALVLERIEALEDAEERARSLTQLAHLKDEFVAMASHELRTPLTSIIGFVQTLRLQRERLSSAQREQFMQIVEDEALRLQRLVEDMLTLSRVEGGRLRVHPEQAGVRAAIDQAIESVKLSAVEVDCAGELSVYADPHHLHQILVNYLTNGQRYGDPPYRVSARQGPDGLVVIAVEDRGPGVDEAFRPRLFERFAQDKSHSRGSTGTGLGLSITRELARTQGGEAWYEPRDGGGSRFLVSLPNQPAAGRRTGWTDTDAPRCA